MGKLARPIIVMSMPRSGSSMVAGIFAQHGVWTGTCRRPDSLNEKGHFENIAIKQAIIHAVGPVVNEGRVAEPVRGWAEAVEQIIRRAGYREGPWLWKGSAMYWRLWEPMDPVWVCVHRDRASIEASGRESGLYQARPESVDAHLAALGTLYMEHFGIVVSSDAVVAGDYSTIERALKRAGIEPNEALIEDWIEPSLWRH